MSVQRPLRRDERVEDQTLTQRRIDAGILLQESNPHYRFAEGVLTIKAQKQEERRRRRKASMPTRSRRISKRVGL